MSDSADGGQDDASDGVDLTPDDLPARLRAERDLSKRGRFDQEGTAKFAGLLGDDDDRGRIRIYLDYELNTYVLVARDDIVHRQQLTNSAGVTVSMVFVRKGATVLAREVSSEEAQADALAQALEAVEGQSFASSEQVAITPTIRTITIATATVCTRVFCTNFTCSCTSRHSLTCSLFCPLPRTPFCPGNQS